MQVLHIVSLTEPLQCNFFLAQKWTVTGEMGLQYRQFFAFMQQNEEEIQGQENLGTAPLQLHSMKGLYFIMSGDSLQVSW